jgi:Nucleotidyl transferase AbiEii toxin, Type IV TA system
MLDRQHPRDMFDVKELLENEGITQDIRRAFVVYLAGHNRPMEELLAPTINDVEKVYENEFVGMTTKPIAFKDLISARKECIDILRETMDDKDKAFLISIMEQKPDWTTLGIPNLDQLYRAN